jgi:hypothetical protein
MRRRRSCSPGSGAEKKRDFPRNFYEGGVFILITRPEMAPTAMRLPLDERLKMDDYAGPAPTGKITENNFSMRGLTQIRICDLLALDYGKRF